MPQAIVVDQVLLCDRFVAQSLLHTGRNRTGVVESTEWVATHFEPGLNQPLPYMVGETGAHQQQRRLVRNCIFRWFNGYQCR
jgi:hypothetical protein